MILICQMLQRRTDTFQIYIFNLFADESRFPIKVLIKGSPIYLSQQVYGNSFQMPSQEAVYPIICSRQPED